MAKYLKETGSDEFPRVRIRVMTALGHEAVIIIAMNRSFDTDDTGYGLLNTHRL